MSDFTLLTPDDCPLLQQTPELMDRFNEVVRQFDQFQQVSPKLLERDSFQPVVRDLAEVRSRLTRGPCVLAFLGGVQVGKSATFNHLLDNGDETAAPSPVGAGAPTTRIPTRLRRSATDLPTVLLRYCTPAEYMQTRGRLVEAVQLNPGQGDRELLRHLPAHTAETIAGRHEGVATDDIETLRLLLESHAELGGGYVEDPPVEWDLDFDSRAEHLSHPPAFGGPPELSAGFLLHEARVGFPTDRIPASLDLLDLPGLGTPGLLTTLLTRELVDGLDGALLFLRADQFADAASDVIVTRLRQLAGDRLNGRIGVVVTMLDVLTERHYPAAAATLLQFLDRHGLGRERVCLVSNRLYREPGRAGELLPRAAAHEEPALRQAFEELVRDGGIGRLRRLVADDLFGGVVAELRDWAAGKLAEMTARLAHDLDMEKRRLTQDLHDRRRANQCRLRVHRLLTALETRAASLEPLARLLKDGLQKEFAEHRLDNAVLARLSAAELAREFERQTGWLEKQLHALLDTAVVGRVYEEVGKDFAALPAVPVWEFAEGPRQAWEAFARQDGSDRSWRQGTFPTFLSPDLFAGLTDARLVSPLDGPAYTVLMEEKIRVVAQQAFHALRLQVKRRLQTLLAELSKLVDERGAHLSREERFP